MKTPRIIVTVNTDIVTAKGNYIDFRENEVTFSKSFNDEESAMIYLHNMRENDNCEFSIQVNRTNWKM